MVPPPVQGCAALAETHPTVLLRRAQAARDRLHRLLVLDERSRRSAPWKPQTQRIAQAHHEVVPAGVDRHARQMRQVRVLLA